MQFSHSSALWQMFPELVAGVVHAEGLHDRADVAPALARLTARAQAQLAGRTESDLVAIQAWRRAFQRMGLKPTQYRCASEALHDGAASEVRELVAALQSELQAAWGLAARSAILSRDAPAFQC